jgi:ribose 5-phosphate isomerase A
MREENLLAIIDVTIDGADEVDDELNLIKGGGGALLGEKIIVQATKKFIVIVDEGKLSRKLGINFAVPIEVVRKAEDGERAFLEMLGAVVKKRLTANNEEYITDEGNIILDAKFEQIDNVDELSKRLNARAGIVEHGIFEKCYVEKIVCAKNDGEIIIYQKQS